MVTATVYARGKWSVVETYEHLKEAIDGMLDMWNEDEGCFVVILSDDRGVPYATMIRDLVDGELCTLTYPSGTTVRYRSHYELDGERRYRRTDVRVLEYREPADEMTRAS